MNPLKGLLLIAVVTLASATVTNAKTGADL